MDQGKSKQESTPLLASLGWLLLNLEERQLLRGYVELALKRESEEERDKQDRLNGGAEDGYKAGPGKSSRLQESA